jgi:hypothetical protein
MAGPVWARWVFALLFAGVGVFCAVRLLADRGAPRAVRRPERHTTDAAHLLMAAGMTVMFIPVATPVPPMWWAVVFAVDSAWLGLRLLGLSRDGAGSAAGPPHGRAHLLSHLSVAVAMAYMFAVMPADGLAGSGLSHTGHLSASNAGFAVLGWLAVAYFLGHAVCCGIRVAVPGSQPGTAARDRAASGGAAGLAMAHGNLTLGLVMGLGMSYMLMTML